jgi:hypothetical protein
MEAWQSLVYCTCLENRRVERHREFESHRFRQTRRGPIMVLEQIANLSVGLIRLLGSSPSLSAKQWCR